MHTYLSECTADRWTTSLLNRWIQLELVESHTLQSLDPHITLSLVYILDSVRRERCPVEGCIVCMHCQHGLWLTRHAVRRTLQQLQLIDDQVFLYNTHKYNTVATN